MNNVLSGTRPHWGADGVYMHYKVNRICGLGHAPSGVMFVLVSLLYQKSLILVMNNVGSSETGAIKSNTEITAIYSLAGDFR